jgi:hypothetical protein
LEPVSVNQPLRATVCGANAVGLAGVVSVP